MDVCSGLHRELLITRYCTLLRRDRPRFTEDILVRAATEFINPFGVTNGSSNLLVTCPREKLADLADVFPIFSRVLDFPCYLPLADSIEHRVLVVVVIGYTPVTVSSRLINDITITLIFH